MIKIQNKQVIDVGDWDTLVEETYGRPYSFQQQGGCKERGTHDFTVPDGADDYEGRTSISENDDEMGVTFAAWLERDPKEPSKEGEPEYHTHMFWERHFYPDMQMIANDLHEKGLLPAGSYMIDIDW